MMSYAEKVLQQKKNELIGKEFVNTVGLKYKIIDYVDSHNVKIRFEETGFETFKANKEVHNGHVKDVLYPSKQGIGYTGIGEYSRKTHLNIYETWNKMFDRCYSVNFHKKQPSYIGCSVDKSWHNFQDFARWYEDNYYKIDNNKMQLDKDIIKKGNKIYSPDNCVFVPEFINEIFVTHKSRRGNCPIGVHFHKRDEKFYVQYSKYGKSHYVGAFDNCNDAFNAYKLDKESYIKEVADAYANKIPDKLYHSMYNYIIEIDD